MVKFVEFCRKRSTPDLLPPAQFHCFGDWLSINADTPKDVIYTAYFAHSTQLTAQAAEVLGKTDDAARLPRTVRARSRRPSTGPTSAPTAGSRGTPRPCYVLALAFDLVDGEKAKQAAHVPGRGHRENAAATSRPASSAPRT